jgi:hypothetical protein
MKYDAQGNEIEGRGTNDFEVNDAIRFLLSCWEPPTSFCHHHFTVLY